MMPFDERWQADTNVTIDHTMRNDVTCHASNIRKKLIAKFQESKYFVMNHPSLTSLGNANTTFSGHITATSVGSPRRFPRVYSTPTQDHREATTARERVTLSRALQEAIARYRERTGSDTITLATLWAEELPSIRERLDSHYDDVSDVKLKALLNTILISTLLPSQLLRRQTRGVYQWNRDTVGGSDMKG